MRRINGVYIGPEGIGVGRASAETGGYYAGDTTKKTTTSKKTYYTGYGYD
jgi:hypothetical protein